MSVLRPNSVPNKSKEVGKEKRRLLPAFKAEPQAVGLSLPT